MDWSWPGENPSSLPMMFSLLPHICGTLPQWFISLAPGKFEWNFRFIIFKRILVIAGWGISCEIALMWMSLDLTDEQSTLVMAWCCQATSHHLSQSSPRYLSPCGGWINGIEQDCSSSSALTKEFCTKPSIRHHQNKNYQLCPIDVIRQHKVCVNIDSAINFLPDSTKATTWTDVHLSSVTSYDNLLVVIGQEVTAPSINEISLKPVIAFKSTRGQWVNALQILCPLRCWSSCQDKITTILHMRFSNTFFSFDWLVMAWHRIGSKPSSKAIIRLHRE